MVPYARMRTFTSIVSLAFCGLFVACSSDNPPPDPGIFVTVTGQESDTWTRSPAPAKAELRQSDAAGANFTTLAALTVPPAPYTFTGTDQTGGGAFEIDGLDADGTTLVRGRTVVLEQETLADQTVPIFVQRTGTWARSPDNLDNPHQSAVAALAFDRYLILAGSAGSATGDTALPDVYDLVDWQTLHGETDFPLAPTAMLVSGSIALLVADDQGVWLDLTSGDNAPADPPNGLTFAEVAGGRTVAASDGTLYLVGAARSTGDPTSAVLRVDAAGNMDALRLTGPRLGAAVGFAPGLGLLVAGGSADSFGFEMLAPGASAFVSLAYPSDPIQGAAIVAVPSDTAPATGARASSASAATSTVVLLGGHDPTTGAPGPTRLLDPSCGSSCAATPGRNLEGPFDEAQGFLVDDGAFFVGTGTGGETKTLHLKGGALTFVPLRVPRSGATAVALPNGAIAVAGGTALADGTPALAVETFLP